MNEKEIEDCIVGIRNIRKSDQFIWAQEYENELYKKFVEMLARRNDHIGKKARMIMEGLK